MEMIEKLPFYDNYMLLVEGMRVAEKELIELENPEKQLDRIKKFYQNVGADYTKNQWMVETESNISETTRNEDSRLNQLKRDIRLGSIVENAVKKQDNESLHALISYKDNEMYSKLVKQILFYVGVCNAKSNPEYIIKAGNAITKQYDPIDAQLFIDEGVYYYLLYLDCLQLCLKQYNNHSQYETVKNSILERCKNLKLMLKDYIDDLYIEKEVKTILDKISDLELIINEEGK